MNLDCSVTERIRAEFDTLWRCTQRGNTLEISTPYRMPDSTLFTLFLTERGNRFIACDGGKIWELVREYSELPGEDARNELRILAQENGLKEGDHDGIPIFFKDCFEEKLIGSICFDVANFATMAANVLLAVGSDDAEEREKEIRFTSQANDYISKLLNPGQVFSSRQEIPGVPDIRFSAVIKTTSHLWIVSYIGGNGISQFRKNTSDAALSFKEAWSSSAGKRGIIKRTVPLLNDGANGYKPQKIASRLSELEAEARQRPIAWTDREELAPLLAR